MRKKIKKFENFKLNESLIEGPLLGIVTTLSEDDIAYAEPRDEYDEEGGDDEDGYYTKSKIKEFTLLSKKELTQHDLANCVFSDAKYVVLIDSLIIPSFNDKENYLYRVRVTYHSPESKEYDDAYGDDYNDYDD